MSGLLSGLEGFGLSNLENMDLYEKPKEKAAAAGAAAVEMKEASAVAPAGGETARIKEFLVLNFRPSVAKSFRVLRDTPRRLWLRV